MILMRARRVAALLRACSTRGLLCALTAAGLAPTVVAVAPESLPEMPPDDSADCPEDPRRCYASRSDSANVILEELTGEPGPGGPPG